MARFNGNASRDVTLVIDPNPAYPYPAYTLGTTITVSSAWLKQNPLDVDVVVHEAFHIVQAYPAGVPTPSWIIEGLADYARDRYGMWNAASGWTLPAPNTTSSYAEGYRTTARFFKWLEARYWSALLDELDDEMRGGRYSEIFWISRTNHTVGELWTEYMQFPELGLQ